MSEENKPLGFEKKDADDAEQVAGGAAVNDNQMYDLIMNFINHRQKDIAKDLFRKWSKAGIRNPRLADEVATAFQKTFGGRIDR